VKRPIYRALAEDFNSGLSTQEMPMIPLHDNGQKTYIPMLLPMVEVLGTITENTAQ